MENKKSIILITGIHGVGKSFFCNNIKNNIKINIYSASDLILKKKNTKFKSDKLIKDISNNQNFLYSAVEKIPDNFFILDGHLTLLNKNKEVEKIKFETYERLPISLILLIKNDPKIIKKHLKKRDNLEWDIKFLENFQNAEISYAKEISEKLKIKLIILDPNDHNYFINNYLKDKI